MSDDVIQNIADNMEDDNDVFGGGCTPSQIMLDALYYEDPSQGSMMADVKSLGFQYTYKLCLAKMAQWECEDIYGPVSGHLEVQLSLKDRIAYELIQCGAKLTDDDIELVSDELRAFLRLNPNV